MTFPGRIFIAMTTEKVEWSPTFDTGLQLIDHEHQELVLRLNDLIDKLTSDAPTAAWLPELDELIQHVTEHFSNEERVMENISYSEYISHRNLHRQLLEEVAQFRRELIPDEPVKDTLATIRFLKFWVLRHVMQEDMKIKKFVYGGAYGGEKN